MKYFSAVYIAPVAALEDWMKKPESERKETEAALKAEWDAWLKANAGSVKNTIGLSNAQRVSASGVTSVMNGFMLASYVEAESAEAAAKLFTNHPHLKIPGATIEIMETNPLV